MNLQVESTLYKLTNVEIIWEKPIKYKRYYLLIILSNNFAAHCSILHAFNAISWQTLVFKGATQVDSAN